MVNSSRMLSTLVRAGPRHVDDVVKLIHSVQGMLIIWRPLKPIFSKLFWCRRKLTNLFAGKCPNCR